MNKPKMLYIYFFLLFISIIVIVFVGTTFQVDQVQINKEGVTDFNTGWQLDGRDGSYRNITLPVRLESGAVKNWFNTIQNTLPADMENGMTLSFSTYHSIVRIFVDNKLIYQFGLDNHYKFGKSAACTAWHFVDLPDGSQGKQIIMESCSPYTKYAGAFNSVTIGTKTSNISNMLWHFLPSTIIGLTVLIFGIVLLLVYIIARRKLKHALGLLYHSLFSIAISVSALTETSVLQLASSNVFVLGYIMYFSLMLCPIPYLLFVKTVYIRHQDKLYDIFCLAAAVNFLVCTILQVANILDFPETIATTHFILIASLLLSAYTALEGLIKYNDRSVKPFLIGTVAMFVFLLIDIIRYYNGDYKDGALYCRTGLLIFIAIPAIQTIFQQFSMIELGMEARVLKRLAYMDILTNKRNRTAFEMEMDQLNTEESRGKVTIIAFDLNNLKQVNDNFGHKFGDELIMTAANSIQESFNSFGNCFRIGGDEFVVIAKDCDERQLEICFDHFSEYLKNYNKQNSNKVEIASGYAKYELTDSDLFETCNRADELMYKHKRQMKTKNFVQTDVSAGNQVGNPSVPCE